MRVLHVIAGGRNGGAERFFVDLVEALARAGLSQHAVTRDYLHRRAALEQAGCGVSAARLGSALDLFSARTVRQAERAFRPDVVLAWMSRGAKYAGAVNVPVIGRLGGYYDLKYYSACQHLVCNTPDLVRYCTDRGWSEDRVSFIPNFSPQTDDPPVRRADLNTPSDAKVLLILARLVPSKGVDTAISAFAGLPASFHLWIAGEGQERAALEALVRELGVQDRVRFLGWREDRDALIKAADLCVVSSREEPFGNVVINAWVNGTPVIATASAGPAYLITRGENGMLVPVDDAQALRSAMAEVVRDEALRTKIIAGGSASATHTYSESSVCAAYIDLFEQIKR